MKHLLTLHFTRADLQWAQVQTDRLARQPRSPLCAHEAVTAQTYFLKATLVSVQPAVDTVVQTAGQPEVTYRQT